MKQKKRKEKKEKWPTQKNQVFQPPPKAEQFSPKFKAITAFFVFLALFWAYVAQPDSHIAWVTLSCIIQTYSPKDQSILAIIAQLLVVVEKRSFFESAILNFFFASFLIKLVTIYQKPMFFGNFDEYPDFQQKARGYKIMSHTVVLLLCTGKIWLQWRRRKSKWPNSFSAEKINWSLKSSWK